MPPGPAVAYEEVASVLNVYAEAMCGRAVRVDVTDSEPGCEIVRIADDEIRISVPRSVGRFDSRGENARLLRCIVSHQVGHAEFGTHRFRFERPSRHFRDWRPRLAQWRPGLREATTTLQLFGRLGDPTLARAVFLELEELRVEAALQRTYPGLSADLRWYDDWRATQRTDGLGWLRRAAAADREVLAGATSESVRLREVSGRVRSAGATVEDTVEATLRVYALVRRAAGPGSLGTVAEEDPSDRGLPVARRQGTDRRRAGEPDPRASAFGVAPDDGDEDRDEQDGDLEGRASDTPSDAPSDAGRRTTAAGRPFSYPEWDFRAQTYLRAHVTVWERVGTAGPTAPYHAALREYAWLLGATRARFEAIAAWAPHDRVRDVDGDSLDLDAVIDHAVSRRARDGHATELVYSRRGALRRDVAAAILLDVSATTAEPILRRRDNTDPGGTGPDQGRQTILAVERTASVLMARTADDLGDQVAFYAFSGLGRRGVDVATVKDFDEALDHRVAARVGGLRPQRATRMGAAIRHATARLLEQPANRHLMFFVNDGRPFDVDYGRDDSDQGYAIADTRKALDEAVDRGVRAICLTVQANDPTYLPQMCGRVPYESVRYAEELPERLLAAYARLRRPGPPGPTGSPA